MFYDLLRNKIKPKADIKQVPKSRQKISVEKTMKKTKYYSKEKIKLM